MYDALALATLVATGALAVLGLVLTALNRPPGREFKIAVGVVVALLAVQAAIGAVRAFGVTLPEQSTFLIYLAVSVCVLPIATQFAYAEPTRWGGTVVAVGAVATLVAVLRLQGRGSRVAEAPGRRKARATSTGAGRILVAVYGIFALSATARAAVQIAGKFSNAPLAYLLSALAGVVYILATVGLASTRPWARPLAWTAVLFELTGVLVVGTLTVLDAGDFPDDTVWSFYGRGYGFIPLVLPLVGLWWLHRTRSR